MKGKKYICPKSGHIYRVIQEVWTEDYSTGRKFLSVIYTDGNSSYSMDKEVFVNKFKLIDNEVQVQ